MLPLSAASCTLELRSQNKGHPHLLILLFYIDLLYSAPSPTLLDLLIHSLPIKIHTPKKKRLFIGYSVILSNSSNKEKNMKQLLLGALLCALWWSSSTASSASSHDIAVPVVCTHEFWSPAFDHGGKTLEDYLNWVTPHFSDSLIGEFGSKKVGTLPIAN